MTAPSLDAERVNRVHRLDAIRGVLAVGVMLYHVGLAPVVFGTYGVYAFFVLSGFALEHVYHGRLGVGRFAVARFARLAPLWIPVVLVSAVAYGMTDPWRVVWNMSGLFGFTDPGATSIVTGGWSIGIEVVFYVFFPLLTLLATRWLVVLTVLAYGLRAWTFPPDGIEDWVAYTVPASFLVFFTLGMVLARIGDTSSWTGRPAKFATILGDMSYGIYLLHPLVLWFTGSAFVMLLLTPPLALVIHAAYERPAGRWIRELASRRPDRTRVEPTGSSLSTMTRPAPIEGGAPHTQRSSSTSPASLDTA